MVAAEAELKYQAGAFPGSPVQPGAMCAFAPYDIENVKVVGYDVVTNRPKVAAYRAPGAPISEYAVECVVDDIASRLGMDPIELRLLNALGPGDSLPTGQVVEGSCPVAETIRAAAAIPVPAAEALPRDPIRLPGGAGNTTRGEGVQRVWLVTQPFHGRRARGLFRRAGLDPRVWAIDDGLQHQHPARALRWIAREYAAWAGALARRSR